MTPRGLEQAALNRRQVTGLPWGRSQAAWVISMSFRFVMGQLPKLKLYKPDKKRKVQEEIPW